MTSSLSTKDKIITTTTTLIRKQGVAATGINDIVANTGIPKGSIYYHFPGGKEEIVVACVESSVPFFQSFFKKNLKGKHTALDGLSALIDGYMQFLKASNYALGCPIGVIAMEASGNNEAISQACKNVMDLWVDSLVDYFIYKGSNARKNEAFDFIYRLEGAIIMSQIYQHVEALLLLKKQLKNILND
jgi:TetR/AcrR family transcriptional regulator, lmrAB and yxaGH operons repressor